MLFRRETIPAAVLQAGLAVIVVVDLWGVDRRYLSGDQLVAADRVEQTIETFDYDRFLIERRFLRPLFKSSQECAGIQVAASTLPMCILSIEIGLELENGTWPVRHWYMMIPRA